jgi:hypothetical protein
MKQASAATLAILSGGQYIKADLYRIVLATGQTYYLSGFDTPLTAAVFPSATSNVYKSGYTITRGSTTQEVGVDAQEMQLTFQPQWDDPGGVPLIAGYSIMQAAQLGLLDNASIFYSKLFMSKPSPGALLSTSPGAVGWFLGAVSDIDFDRASVTVKLSSNLLVLSQVQMPRNLYQSGCVHTVYDAGCTLLKSAFTVSGAITVATNGGSILLTNLGQAADYFDLGVVTFTSGANAGLQATIKSFSSATINLSIPFPSPVAIGDTFTIYPGCDHLQATCTTKFNNLAHFKGMPYVPVVETLYDGGTSNPPIAAPVATQPGQNVGSKVSGNIITSA